MGHRDPGIGVVVTTYRQPRTLLWVLAALARQTRGPARVVVADDGSDAATLEALRGAAPALPFDLVHVWQPDESFRAARSRNNAIAVLETPVIGFLDQDMLPPAHWCEALRERLRPGRVCLGGCCNLEADAAARLDGEAIASGAFEAWIPAAERAALERRNRRAAVYAWLRRYGLDIKAKPRLRSGNFMAWRESLLAVNGFDEAFVGWGQEDDDLGRRLYRAGVWPVSCHAAAPVYHIPHPLRRSADWQAGVNTRYFHRRRVPVRCRAGIDGRPYADVRVTGLGAPAGSASC